MGKQTEAAQELEQQLADQTEFNLMVQQALVGLQERVTALEEGIDVPEEPPTEPPTEPPSGPEVPAGFTRIYFSGGETGAIQPKDQKVDGWGVEAFMAQPEQAEQIQVVTSQSRSGSHSIRTYFKNSWGTDPNGKIRSELKAPGNIFLEMNREYYMGFSGLLLDNDNNRKLIAYDAPNGSYCQWHFDDSGTSQIHLRQGDFVGNFGKFGSSNLGAINLGQWDDWVVHCKVSAGSDGFAKIWRNGTLVYDKTGSSAYSRLNFKIGVYRGKQEWNGADYAETFYDDIWIATKD